MKKQRLEIDIDCEIAKAITSYSRTNNINPNEAIEECLQEYFGKENEAGYDPLFYEIKSEILFKDTITASFLQRHYQIGFRRACRLIQQLEYTGYVKSQGSTKPYKIIKNN